jgi:DNA invertase Pin-like site-specific DNA recombinase
MKVGYARVSVQLQTTEPQLDALKGAGCERIFEETASGAQRDRPQLIAALDYLREGDQIVVWRLDRLARSLKQLLETVEDLDARKIGLLSLIENIQTDSVSGKLVFHIFAALAEFERNLIRQRTMQGLIVARKMGRVGGRPPSLDQTSLRAARAMLADDGLTVAEVATRLNVAVSTLYRHLPGGRAALEHAGA